jgi:hypothetical protein
MFPFAIKKAFFDLWDQLFFVLIVNFLFTTALLGLGTLPLFFPVGMIVVLLLGGIASFWAKDLAVNGGAKWRDAWPHFLASWKVSLATAVLWALIGLGFTIGVPFYTQLNSWAGLGFGALLFWGSFFLAGMSLYLPGLQAQVGGNLKALARKSFMLFLAHPLQALLLAVFTVLFVALSVVTLGFFPGILGVHLWLQVAFRFVLARYEWQEKNPAWDKKKPLPWKVILADDLERLGPRTLRNMIFPWKD